MEMVNEALEFWYERQEKGKVAFQFKCFLEGKRVRDAPPRKKIAVYKVGKGKKPVRSKERRKGRADTESGSDDEAWPRKEAVEEPQSNDEVHSGKGKNEVGSKGKRKGEAEAELESNESESDESNEARPSKTAVAKSTNDAENERSISNVDEAKLKEVTLTEPSMKPLSHRVKDADVSFWEANYGGSESTDVIELVMEPGERGKKRKHTDDDASPVKTPRLEPMYKLGPRNARPGKIKQTLPVVQGPVQKAEELKPVVEVSIGKFHKQSTIASQAGPSQPQIPLVHLNFTKSSDGDHVKPKPKPKPIKGKVSEGELGIVTRDRSKRIAQESVRSTHSKKLKTT
jgi:hypothetical protein